MTERDETTERRSRPRLPWRALKGDKTQLAQSATRHMIPQLQSRRFPSSISTLLGLKQYESPVGVEISDNEISRE